MLRLSKSLSVIIPALMVWPLLLTSGAPANATPITWGNRITVPPKWPKGTLKVYVQPDPKSQGRDALVKEGIERWKSSLAARGITLEVSVGAPPAGADKPIRYTWEADGFSEHGQKLGGENDAIAGADGRPTGGGKGELTSGAARIRNALPAASDDDKKYLKNLAEHEFVHILGIGDDDNGAVTKHEQDSADRPLNALDLKELNSLYGTAQTEGTKAPHGVVEKLAGGPGDGFWEYRFTLDAANLIPTPGDPEHVAYITFALDLDLVSGLVLPPGWIGLVPNGAVSPDDPFFSEGYMIDAFSTPPPWSGARPMSYIALRTSVAEAARDGLPPDFDPALSLVNPTLVVRVLTTRDVDEGSIHVWAGEERQTVDGPVPVPEPTVLVLLGIAGITAASRRRRL